MRKVKNPNKTSNKKVIKYKKQRSIDIHIIILVFVFIYFVVNAWIAFGKKHISIYEVTNSSIVDSNTYNAFVYMDQELVHSTSSGYINYYFKDGTKASVNDIICSVGTTKQGNTEADYKDSDNTMEIEDIRSLNNFVRNYRLSFDSNKFSNVYDFKDSLENKLYEIHNLSSFLNVENLHEESNAISTVAKSGLVSYTLTGYEDVTLDNISSNLFTEPQRESNYLLSETNVTPGSPMYKLIVGYDWSLVFPVPEKDLEHFANNENKMLSISFVNHNITANAKVSTFERNNTLFAKLDFNSLLSNFILTPFTEIEIEYNRAEGLKIPNSAIVEKEFYKVPLDSIFPSKGANVIIPTNLVDEEAPKQIEIEVYFKTNEYALILNSVVPGGTTLQKQDSDETFTVGDTITLEGVYSVNKGYTIFRRIEKEISTDSFTIIKKGTSYGISLFDHIATNSESVVETEIIY